MKRFKAGFPGMATLSTGLLLIAADLDHPDAAPLPLPETVKLYPFR
ncbi:hypothetical protein [Sphingomonas sp.]